MTDNSQTRLQSLGNVSLLPTIQHCPKIASNAHIHTPPIKAQQKASEGFQQSRSVLNRNYGKDLNRALMARDSFYLVHDLFKYKAFAEVQFLNLIQVVLSRESDVAALHRKPSLENLLFHKDLLESHARSLRENIESIKSRGGPDWSHVEAEDNPKHYRIAQEHSESLLSDYNWLLRRTEELSSICDRGMQDYNNKSTREEMLLANKRAADMHNLTRIATFFTFVYVPLNFTTSVFSMNFTVFGTGKLHIWIWAVVSALVMLISSLAMLVVVLKRNARWRATWPFRRQRYIGRVENLEMGEMVDTN
jgi:Mg2+ and Co2+ transporter CorA